MNCPNFPSRTFTLIALTVALCSCKKENVNSPCDLPDAFVTYFRESGQQYKMPDFHPDNNYQFVYYFKDYSNNNSELRVCDVGNTEHVVVTSEVEPISAPKWNSSGWIAFIDKVGQKLKVVKSSGDSSFVFFDQPYSFYCAWLPENGIYWLHSSTQGVPYQLLHANVYGSEIDTVYNGFLENLESTQNGHIAAIISVDGKKVLAMSNTNSHEIEFEPVPLPSHIKVAECSDIAISPSGTSLYLATHNQGLLVYNRQTNVHHTLIPSCERMKYTSISCSPNGAKLIGERVLTTPEYENGDFTGVYLQQSEIYLIDLATGIEQKVPVD